MINVADLSAASISEYIMTESASGNPIPDGILNVGVWYDDVSVVISAYGVDAETAYDIFNSV